MVEDVELLQRIAKGDERAMQVFYEHYATAVYQFAYKTVINEADASEVLNEVMLEIWRKADTFAGRSKVKTWLLSITHNKAVDQVRRKSRHDMTDEFDNDIGDMDLTTSDGSSLENACVGAENSQHVKQCMTELKDGHRQVVYLTFFQGLSYPDIASILSVPAGTVKTRMMHAKQQLMTCITRLTGYDQPVT